MSCRQLSAAPSMGEVAYLVHESASAAVGTPPWEDLGPEYQARWLVVAGTLQQAVVEEGVFESPEALAVWFENVQEVLNGGGYLDITNRIEAKIRARRDAVPR